MNERQGTIENYLMLSRSHEGIKLLEVEVHNAVNFYAETTSFIVSEIQCRAEPSKYNIGAKCLLMKLLDDVVDLERNKNQAYKNHEGNSRNC